VSSLLPRARTLDRKLTDLTDFPTLERLPEKFGRIPVNRSHSVDQLSQDALGSVPTRTSHKWHAA
jgi:hypothetical protein